MFQRAIVVLTFLISLNQNVLCQSDRILPNCPLHIIIALDFSASERAYIEELQTVLYALTSRFELHPNSLRIGIISFNRGAQLIQPLTGDTDSLEMTIASLRIPLNVFATDIHAAFALADREFRKNSLESVPKYFILVSDGDPHAHARGYGFRADLTNAERLRNGDPLNTVDPVHVFCIYSGRDMPYHDRFSEEVRRASIKHLQNMASSETSFYLFEQYPELVNFLELVSSCL